MGLGRGALEGLDEGGLGGLLCVGEEDAARRHNLAEYDDDDRTFDNLRDCDSLVVPDSQWLQLLEKP